MFTSIYEDVTSREPQFEVRFPDGDVKFYSRRGLEDLADEIARVLADDEDPLPAPNPPDQEGRQEGAP